MDNNKLNKILKDYIIELGDSSNILTGNILDSNIKKFLLNDSNAFLIGLICDQSVKAEIAWSLPFYLNERLETFDFTYIINNFDEKILEEKIKTKPALHRFPSRMASYIFNAMKDVINLYDGDASNIWNNQSAKEIVNRLEKFKGISHKKASLGTLLLVRDLGVIISDKENIDIAYDVHIKRIFCRIGLVKDDSEENVLNAARKLNSDYPGEFTTPFWAIGRNYCDATNPNCSDCPVNKICKKII